MILQCVYIFESASILILGIREQQIDEIALRTCVIRHSYLFADASSQRLRT